MIHKLKERCISECSLVLISLNSSFYGFPRSTARREGDGSVPTLAWSLSMTLLFGRRQETTHNLSSFVRQRASSGWSRKWGSTGTAGCLRRLLTNGGCADVIHPELRHLSRKVGQTQNFDRSMHQKP